jgi:hypothetical protein
MDLRLTALSAIAALALVALWPAQATATHVQCGEVITQDTKLDNDLLNCPPDLEPNPPPFKAALTIGADDVTLDLNGHTLQTGVVFAGTGTTGIDNAGGYDDITVKDGTIDHYEYPVFISGGADNAVTNVNLSGRGGVIAYGVSGMQVTKSVIEGGAWGGIYLYGPGGPARIESNVVSRGISGIEAPPSAEGRIVISGNVLNGNFDGIYVPAGRNVVAEHNHVTGTVGAIGYGGIGIYARGGLVKHNLVEQNGDGIIALGSTIVSHNTANFNQFLGIDADLTVIDGGGNRASGNGNPLQCLNVFCK